MPERAPGGLLGAAMARFGLDDAYAKAKRDLWNKGTEWEGSVLDRPEAPVSSAVTQPFPAAQEAAFMVGPTALESRAMAGSLSDATLSRLPLYVRNIAGLDKDENRARFLGKAFADNAKRFAREHFRRSAPLEPFEQMSVGGLDEAVVRNASRQPAEHTRIVQKPGDRYSGSTYSDAPVHTIELNTAKIPADEAFGTKLRSVLEHERGERATWKGEAPEMPFDSHGGPVADVRELYAASRDPAVYEAAVARMRRSPSPVEVRLEELYRQAGGTTGHPLEPTGRGARGVMEKIAGEYPELRTLSDDKQAAMFRAAKSNPGFGPPIVVSRGGR